TKRPAERPLEKVVADWHLLNCPVGLDDSGPTGPSERDSVLPDSQVIFHREDSWNGIRHDPRNVLVHLIHHHAFKRNVPIFHDDMDLRYGAHGVPPRSEEHTSALQS